MSAGELIVAEAFPERAAVWITRRVGRALDGRERVSLALCGGSTPAPVYSLLAAADLEWSRVDLYFGDERCVPPDDPDSTYNLVLQAWLEPARGELPRVHRMQGEDPDFERAARHYEALLPPRFDLLILGVGEDGHTASLFPGDSALAEEQRRVVHVVSPKPPPDRLTLTPPVLREARNSVVLAQGTGKAQVLQAILEGSEDPLTYPAQLVRGGTWILDPAAASALSVGDAR